MTTPFILLELWFDIRSLGRRLVPELSGSVGISAVATAIVIGGDGSTRVAAAIWLVLAGRALASIPFVRTQITRLRHGTASLTMADSMQVVGILVAATAVVVESSAFAGVAAVIALAIVQAAWMRRDHVPPAKVLGMFQLVLGLTVVATTAAGVLLAYSTARPHPTTEVPHDHSTPSEPG